MNNTALDPFTRLCVVSAWERGKTADNGNYACEAYDQCAIIETIMVDPIIAVQMVLLHHNACMLNCTV